MNNKMRAKEVANYLSISLSTVWLYAKQKKITPIKLSKRVTLFDVDEINSLLNNSIIENEDACLNSQKVSTRLDI